MDNQYYTPVWAEFHPGFEYEEKREDDGTEDGIGWDSTSEGCPFFWRKEVFNPRYGSDISDVIYGIDTAIIRVRCLNREDIESLGWAHSGESDCEISFIWPPRPDIGLILVHSYGTVVMSEDEEGKRWGIFHGVVKNLNAMRIVMQQIGMI